MTDFVYVLIAYKPSGEDWCRGCHMQSFASEFAYVSGALDVVADAWVEYTTRAVEPLSPKWELTVLLNGREIAGDNTAFSIDPDDEPELFEEAVQWAHVSKERLAAAWTAISAKLAEQAAMAMAKKTQDEQKKLDADKLRELAELARLRQKYPQEDV